VLKTIATSGTGVAELVDAVWRFKAQSETRRAGRRRARSESALREIVSRRFLARLEQSVLAPGELDALVDRVGRREIDPYAAADELLARAGLKTGPNRETGSP
jgi:LAO/AO transport system kinase